jgi:twitching motility protein PilT
VPPHLKPRLHELIDLDFAHSSEEGFRFRVNLFRQRQNYGLVLRVINSHIRTMEELQLPKVMHTFAKEQRGIILVSGATGSGKSTTLASIIEKINHSRPAHIITIEDPIEFIFKDRKATINQREIGIDTATFAAALRSALRQNPDVILVGELRDRETTETALMAAETGHLVLSTLHTMDAVESLTRLLSYFPPHQHESLRLMLAQTLRYVVSQRLIPRSDKKGLVPAMEILAANELVRDEIQKGDDFKVLRDTIKSSRDTYDMQTFDQSLLELVNRGIISEETALEFASNAKDLALDLQGFGR